MDNKIIGNKKIAAIVLGSLLLSACGGQSDDSLPSLYSLGGTVSGLGGNKIVLLNNNGENELTISANGKFTFPERFYLPSRYNISIKTQPPGQRCRVMHGEGTLSRGSVFNVRVVCQNSGSLDASFNTNGIFVHHGAAEGNGDDEGNSLALDASEGILVTGYSLNASGNKAMTIWRYGSSGTYGYLWSNSVAGNGNDEGNSLALDANGRILVTGYSLNASGDKSMVIWSYDTSANNLRAWSFTNPAGDFSALSIALDNSDKILVAGYGFSPTSKRDMLIWRFDSNINPDPSFDTNGLVSHHNAAGGKDDDVASAITLEANGKILVTGYSVNASGNKDMVIWRYMPDGSLDDSFGTNGIVVHDNAAGGKGDDEGLSIKWEAATGIFVTGYSYNALGNRDMVIWHYKNDGIIDTDFDTDGIVVHNGAAGGNGDDVGRSLTLDVDLKILVTGYSNNASNNKDMVVWRYHPDGTPDSNFDTDGIVVHNGAAGGNGDDEGRSLMLDFNGKIMVTGYSRNALNNKDMVIWRYNP